MILSVPLSYTNSWKSLCMGLVMISGAGSFLALPLPDREIFLDFCLILDILRC